MIPIRMLRFRTVVSRLWLFCSPQLLRFSSFSGESRHTIYALASGGVRCALAVIRVSGPKAADVLVKMANFSNLRSIEPRKAILRKLHNVNSGNVIDHGLVLWFPGPKSFTGEDSCEFHVHGGPAVVTGILRSIGSFPGCRIAEPGEFSKRAFLNGKMDLTAVEGLGDLISAETEMQRAQAFKQMSGALGSLYDSWRDRLAKCLANAEAYIDFGEDENIESDVLENVEIEVKRLLGEMRKHLRDGKKGEIMRNGVRIAILGRPNVGKSSLLNILSKRDAAIVSSVPGTTRDIVESCIDLGGYPVIFADTAGIRASPDEIEKEGIRRAILEAKKSDIVLLLISYEDICKKLTSILNLESRNNFRQSNIINAELRELKILEEPDEALSNELLGKIILVLNKIDLDLDPKGLMPTSTEAEVTKAFDVSISCKTISGLDDLNRLLVKKVSTLCYDPKDEAPCLTRERHRSHIQNCIESLETYLEDTSLGEHDLALRTHNLKVGLTNIGFVTGHLGTEDILDIIFRDFCIGK